MIENDLKIVHKMYKGEYALKFEEIFKTNREIEKDFNTRQPENKDLPIPKWKLHIVSFRTRFYWNFLPAKIRELKPSLFKPALKKHLCDNKQAYLNFSCNYNIIGEEEDNKKNVILEDKKKEDYLMTSLKDTKRNKNERPKSGTITMQNLFLRRAQTEGNLIRITQPRLFMMGAASADTETL